jgi:hypothetical protein
MKKIEFEINGLTFEMEKISIKDYYEIKTDLLLNGRDAEFEIISKLSRCPVDLLKQLSLADWEALTFHFNLMIDKNLGENPELINQFTHDGIEYGLIDWDKITIGEFADLDVIVTSPNADSRLHEVLAILYRPIVKKKWKKNIVEEYDYDGFKERSEIFLHAPLYLVKAVTGFFLTIAQTSLNLTKESLEMEAKKNPKIQKALQMLTTLLDNGGAQSFTSPEAAHSRLTELQNLDLKKPSTLLPTNTAKQKSKKWNLKKWLTNITA